MRAPTVDVWPTSSLGEEPGHLGLEVEVKTDDARVVLQPFQLPGTRRLEWLTVALIPKVPTKPHRLVLLAMRAERLARVDPEVRKTLAAAGVVL